jgi:tRNA-modifying protein YgfZ
MTERASICALPDRGVVSVTGADAVKLLQGLVTNDVESLVTRPDDLSFKAATAHAGLLSPQGKILFEFFCVRTPDGFVLDVSLEKAAELVKRLTLYKLRAAVEIKDVSEAYKCLALWGPNACSSGPTKGTIAFIDPRHPELGQRILAEARFATDIASATNGMKADPQAYVAHRIALGVPEGGKDYDFGDAYPHEADFDLYNGVSFIKGCYVGQEIVARMQHKTTIRKRVVPVVGNTALPGDRPEITAGGVAIGKLGSVSGTSGLAMLRLDRAQEFTGKGVALLAGAVPMTRAGTPLLAEVNADPAPPG